MARVQNQFNQTVSSAVKCGIYEDIDQATVYDLMMLPDNAYGFLISTTFLRTQRQHHMYTSVNTNNGHPLASHTTQSIRKCEANRGRRINRADLQAPAHIFVLATIQVDHY
ncbi:Hypothetical_protein [Hexamita inflata]|uniref:Hypothetical_protein n=1 Tax=Hexamita inflata TaxID=28002 RepID=A0ABP1HIV9_9EUKA